jgi:bifunctional UDP-N-acetylglucosamine pyrophosphorylase/glucosamine-1-phosphate N-acetyltransferase
MPTQKLQAIVLAAGTSSRFDTGKTKLLEKICGQEMIVYPVKILQHLGIATTIVVGYQKEEIKAALNESCGTTLSFAIQEGQWGTGHALKCTTSFWQRDHILIINGDMPLITNSIIEHLYAKHLESHAVISFAVAHNVDPELKSYGRVIKEHSSIKIVEARDFSGDTHEHCCINAGIYIVTRQFLQEYIEQINENRDVKEFYITDLIKIASEKNLTIATISVPFDHIRGVNTQQELWAVEQIKRADLIKQWMDKGIRFSVAQNVHIDLDIFIGSGTHIGSGVQLLNGTVIGRNSTIGEFSSLSNASIGNNVTVQPFCVIKDATIKDHASVGPFAHIQDKTVIESQAIIGNFVEIKRSTIGTGTKVKHLSYLGDTITGTEVNIGAGTITCNHNGFAKNQTIIKDNAYIGSNNTLVAPICIEKGAFTAAGSVITEPVPEEALAIGRSRQVNKKRYARKLQEKLDPEADPFSFSSAMAKIKGKNQSL